MYLKLYKLTLVNSCFPMVFESKFKINLYYEHFPETVEKYARFSNFTHY